MLFYNKICSIYKDMLIKRYDDYGLTRYFTHEDFPGVNKEEFSFIGNHGQKLVGGFYYCDEKRTDKLIIFEHGLGGGHLAYMTEIVYLAKRGYTVFAYDKTGCMASEGESILSITQAISDCNCAINAVKNLPEYKDAVINLIGHSWGGFAVMNVSAVNKNVEKIVAISGLISVKGLLKSYLKGPLSLLISRVEKFEENLNPDLGKVNAVDTLLNNEVKALIIHSDDDKTVSFKHNFAVLRKKIDNDRVQFIATTGKKHNPNYTKDASQLLSEYTVNMQTKLKNKELETPEQKSAFLDSYDFRKMTCQDDELWNKIIEFLG